MLPGAILGLFFAKLLNDGLKSTVDNAFKMELVLDFHWQTIIVGFFIAIIIPLLAMIYPIY